MDFDTEIISEEIHDPTVVKGYKVYRYHFLDYHGFMKNAAKVLEQVPNGKKILEEVRRKFSEAGWEGDGEIQLFWLPPFVGAGVEDTWGICVWHVKQDNNGTSWIMSRVQLPFKRLLDQNDW